MELLLGNCKVQMKNIESNSIDSIITDPPYELGILGKKWDSSGIAYDVEVWKEALRVLKPGGHLLAFGATRTHHRMMVAIEDAGFDIRDCLMHLHGSGFPKNQNIAKAIEKLYSKENKILDEDAKQWEGWGTALKPSYEPIILARKPLSEKTIVKNILKHKTGAINIDESRVESSNGMLGRFPANIIMGCICEENIDGEHTNQECPCYILDKQAPQVGNLYLSKRTKDDRGGSGNSWTNGGKKRGTSNDPTGVYDGVGGASRFFYCSKASKKERNEGINIENKHPTVKSLKLMEYLVRLITPKNGKVLDPFMGSGSTGCACAKLGFDFIGIELNEESFLISQQRINYFKNRKN